MQRPREARGGGGPLQPRLPVVIDALDDGRVISALGMVEEGEQLSIGRKADMAHPTRALIDHFPDRILKPTDISDPPRDRQLRSNRRPVRVLHVLEDLAGGTSTESDARKRSHRLEPVNVVPREGESHLS